jgi:aldose 1-epimerase
LTVGSATVNESLLRLAAGRRLMTDDRGLPTETVGVLGSPFDFTDQRALGDLQLDTAFTDLVRDADGMARIELAQSDGSRRVTVWLDEGFPWVMAYTGDTLRSESHRRTAIALEPMSCPPDALRSGTDLVRIGPGQQWKASWGITPG